MEGSLIGNTFAGRYEIVSVIGAGGMGSVYRARDLVVDRYVALKILRPLEDPARKRQFLREALALTRLNHPNIVRLYDCGEVEGGMYLALEYVEGSTLANLLRESPSRNRIIEIIRQVGRALHHAHQQGILHRDVKPSNILISHEGRVLLSDFGLAIASGESTLTEAGTILGTPAYMSPEQVMGRPLDARSDIFSLGTVAYEALTGRHPFSSDPSREVFPSIVEQNPSLISAWPTLSPIVLRALEKDPARRFQSVAEFVEALDLVAAPDRESAVSWEPVAAPLAPPPTRALLWQRARWIIACLAVVACLAILLLPLSLQAPLSRGAERSIPGLRYLASALGAAAALGLMMAVRRFWIARSVPSASTATMQLRPSPRRATDSTGPQTGESGQTVSFDQGDGPVTEGRSPLSRLQVAPGESIQYCLPLSGGLERNRASTSVHPARSDLYDLEDHATVPSLPYNPLADALSEDDSAPWAWLMMLSGPLRDRQFPLAHSVTIGRSTNNDIILDDLAVSSHHARIFLGNHEIYLHDLGSRHGTKVNGIRVYNLELADRDEIQIGGAIILFVKALSPEHRTTEAQRKLEEFEALWEQLASSVRND